jgi:ribosomal protein S18 acetylase RimI-like enzyme
LVEIRVVRPAEWRGLKRLRLRALATDPDAFGSTLAEERATPDTAWRAWAAEGWGIGSQTTLIAVDGDRWVGMGVCVVLDAEPRTAKVFAMWVAPAARRQGVGRGLLDALTQWASSTEAEELVLDVTEGNTSAMRLYERADFTGTGHSAPLRPDSELRTSTMRKPL